MFVIIELIRRRARKEPGWSATSMRSKQSRAGDIQEIDRDIVARHFMGTASSTSQHRRRATSNAPSCYIALLVPHQLLIERLLTVTLAPYLFDPREPQKSSTVGMADMTRPTETTNTLCIQI